MGTQMRDARVCIVVNVHSVVCSRLFWSAQVWPARLARLAIGRVSAYRVK